MAKNDREGEDLQMLENLKMVLARKDFDEAKKLLTSLRESIEQDKKFRAMLNDVLCQVISRGDVEGVATFLSSLPDLVVESSLNFKENENPLFVALKANNLEILKLLLANGVEITETFGPPGKEHKEEKTPYPPGYERYSSIIYYACSANCSLEVIKCLVEAGADVNKTERRQSNRALLHVLLGDHSGELLMGEGGEEKKINCYRPAHNLRQDVIKYLVDSGADVNYATKEGNTSLMVTDNPELAKFLVEKGADVNAEDVRGMNALLYYVDRADLSQPMLQILKFYIENGVDINHQNDQGMSVLNMILSRLDSFLKTRYKSEEEINVYRSIIHLLKESGCDFDRKNPRGQTPIRGALLGSYLSSEDMDMLAEVGVELNQEDLFAFRFELCAARGDLNELKKMIEEGFDISAQDQDITRAICTAITEEKVEFVRGCVNYGADLRNKALVSYSYFPDLREREQGVSILEFAKIWKDAEGLSGVHKQNILEIYTLVEGKN